MQILPSQSWSLLIFCYCRFTVAFVLDNGSSMPWCLNYPPIFQKTEPPLSLIPLINGQSMLNDSHIKFPSRSFSKDSRWIRLCKILFQPDGTPEFRIQKHLLAEAPPYRALSYTWGSPLGSCVPQDRCEWPNDGSWTTVPTSLGDVTIPVNLVIAVQQLVDNNASEYYWIDAVCINQGDDQERSEQVAMMDRIFQQAKTVDIWLGRADPDTRRVPDIIQRLADFHDEEQRSSYTRTSTHHCLTPMELGILSLDDFEVLSSLLSRRWFRRMWTMQEFALAKEIRMFAGDVEINIIALHKTIQTLSGHRIMTKLVYGSENLTTDTASLSPFLLREAVRGREPSDLLPSYLQSTDTMQEIQYENILAGVFRHTMLTFATDPRDYVNGIVGVANAIADSLKLEYTPFTVDYFRDTAQTFQAFIERLIESSFGLRAILLIRQVRYPIVQSGFPYKDSTEGLPSWVPNLAARDRIALSMPTSDHNRAQPPYFDVKGPGKVTEKPKSLSVTGKNLHISAQRIGKVVNTSVIFQGADNPDSGYHSTVRSIRLLNQLPLAYIGTRQTPLEVLLDTLRLGDHRADKSCSTREPSVADLETNLSRAVQCGIWIISKKPFNHSMEKIVSETLSELNSNPWTIPGLSASFMTPSDAISFMSDLQLKWEETGSNNTGDEHPELNGMLRKSYDTLYRAFGSRLDSTNLLLVEMDSDFVSPSLRQDRQAKTLLLGVGSNTIREGDELWVAADHEWPLVLQPHRPLERPLTFFNIPNEFFAEAPAFGEIVFALDHDVMRAFQSIAEKVASETPSCAIRPLFTQGLEPHQLKPPVGKGKDNNGVDLKLYNLRGETYIHGIMRGELFRESGPEWQEIVLV